MAPQDVSVLSVARQLDVRAGTHGVLPNGTHRVLDGLDGYSAGTLVGCAWGDLRVRGARGQVGTVTGNCDKQP